MNKKFHIGAVLSVATGYNLVVWGQFEIDSLVNFMLGTPNAGGVDLGQIARCKGPVLAQYPQFGTPEFAARLEGLADELESSADPRGSVNEWVAAAAKEFGETLDIEPVAKAA